jgi:hypothetical protein
MELLKLSGSEESMNVKSGGEYYAGAAVQPESSNLPLNFQTSRCLRSVHKQVVLDILSLNLW